jgi:Mn2+/Fe2+ NRAMP family transporter
MNTFATRRDREARTITAVISAVCLLACVAAVIPGVEHAINTAVIVLGVLLVLIVAVRLGLRWLRERREDRADEVTAAAWRAAHQRDTGARTGVA